jgi:DedD protein
MSTMAEPADINVDELRRRARRRLVGAIVLALGVAVVVPMLLETEQKPLGEDVSVKIPPVDDGKFVNRLNDKSATAQKGDEAGAPKPSSAADAASTTAAPSSETASSPTTSAGSVAEPVAARTSKYDTRLPEAREAPAKADTAGTAANAPAPAAANAPAATANASATAANTRATANATPAATTSASVAKAQEPASTARASAGAPTAPAAKPAPSSTAETRVAAHAASPSASHHEGFAVQLAAFADDKGANSLANRLKRAGYAAYTEPLKTSKGTLWRVRVGPYSSREAALAARDKLKTEGQSGIVAAAR